MFSLIMYLIGFVSNLMVVIAYSKQSGKMIWPFFVFGFIRSIIWPVLFLIYGVKTLIKSYDEVILDFYKEDVCRSCTHRYEKNMSQLEES